MNTQQLIKSTEGAESIVWISASGLLYIMAVLYGFFIDNMIGELSKEIMKKMWFYWKIEIDRIAVMR